MKKFSLKEMKGALSRDEMKHIVAGGSLQYFPGGSCWITFNSACAGYAAGQSRCININSEYQVTGCNYYTNWCNWSNPNCA